MHIPFLQALNLSSYFESHQFNVRTDNNHCLTFIALFFIWFDQLMIPLIAYYNIDCTE